MAHFTLKFWEVKRNQPIILNPNYSLCEHMCTKPCVWLCIYFCVTLYKRLYVCHTSYAIAFIHPYLLTIISNVFLRSVVYLFFFCIWYLSSILYNNEDASLNFLLYNTDTEKEILQNNFCSSEETHLHRQIVLTSCSLLDLLWIDVRWRKTIVGMEKISYLPFFVFRIKLRIQQTDPAHFFGHLYSIVYN